MTENADFASAAIDTLDRERSTEQIVQLMQERSGLEIKSLKSQIETLIQSIEIERRGAQTKVVTLKEEIEEMTMKNKQLNEQLLQIKAENENLKATVLTQQSRANSLEKKLFQHFGVQNVEDVFSKADQLFQFKEELDISRHVQRELEVRLMLEKQKSAEGKSNSASNTINAEFQHQIQLLSNQITESAAELKVKSQETADMRTKITKLEAKIRSMQAASDASDHEKIEIKKELSLEKSKNAQFEKQIQTLLERQKALIVEKTQQANDHMKDTLDSKRRLQLITTFGKRINPAFAAIEQTSSLFPLFTSLSSFMECLGGLSIDDSSLNRSFCDVMKEARTFTDKTRKASTFVPSVKQLLDTIEKQKNTISELIEERDEYKERTDQLEENDAAPELSATILRLQKEKIKNSMLEKENEELRSSMLSPNSSRSGYNF